jgi:N-acetylmuramoyl-L-alanine amidase
MELPHLLRSFASGTALAGAVACLLQVPKIWDAEGRQLTLTAATLKEELHAFTVVLDAGHGGDDGGTKGAGILEKDGTLEITLRLEKALRERGVRVRMTREDDHYLTLPDRCDIANGSRADAFVSIHLNAAPGSDAAGIETYFSSKQKLTAPAMLRSRLGLAEDVVVEDQRSAYLAACIQRRVGKLGGTSDRGSRDSGFYVVKHSECPAVLVECGYLTSADEAARLKSAKHKDLIAKRIADGVAQFLLATKFNPQRGIMIGAGGAAPASGDTRDAPD